ncbi:MAG TPA: SpoIIE family protein phosphatase [Thermoleophilaceae bacterium]|nr:SpoIIE family protein phosphatase [Thermoleophilaceae bacterium]
MTSVRDDFRNAYAAAFHDYVTQTGEQGLERAYDLGRTAVSDGVGMLDLAAIHHEVLAEALALASSPEEHQRAARAATEFAMESLSTFEMAQRGFHEAQEAVRLEQGHAGQLRALADAALEIAAARTLDELAELVTVHALEIVGAGRAAASLRARDGSTIHHTIAQVDSPIQRTERRGMPPLHEWVCAGGEVVRLNGKELEAHPSWSRQDPPDGTASWLAVPLMDRAGRNIGLFHLSDKRDGAFSHNDEAILVQLSQIFSVAIENLRLYEHEHDIAQTLQRSLLPPSLPEIPGVALAARFRPAGAGDEVGGDFYDIFEMGSDRWGIAVGDVCGKGAAAATVTALARYTLRATALHEREPSRILAVLNQALMRHAPEQRFCTIAYAALEPERGRLEIASGGHPPPLLLRRGKVETLGSSGMILGIMDDPPLNDSAVALEPGDTVVFYTDGVTDAHAPERMLSHEQLAAGLAECEGYSPAEVANHIETLALGGIDAPPRDDIAIVVLSLESGARSRHVEAGGTVEMTLELPPTAESAGAAREALAPLGERLDGSRLETIRLLVTELITNSIKHGEPGEAPVKVKVTLNDHAVRVEVSDSGPGFEPPPRPSEPPVTPSGWGLYLVERLADRWGVDSSGGSAVWFEISASDRA